MPGSSARTLSSTAVQVVETTRGGQTVRSGLESEKSNKEKMTTSLTDVATTGLQSASLS